MNRILSAVEADLVAQRHMPCYCSAYSFPHRVGSGACQHQWPQEPRGLYYRGSERDEDLRLFDRQEAAAINAERERINNVRTY